MDLAYVALLLALFGSALLLIPAFGRLMGSQPEGAQMNPLYWIGLALALGLGAYLFYAMLKPERF